MSVESLKNALETRGYAIDTIAAKPPASLERLLPLAAESDDQWLARRAATELTVDPDLRFLQFHQMVVPDTGAGQPVAAIGLETAMSELKHLLDPQAGENNDPLTEKLNAIADRGRRSAAVTRLEISPDLRNVMVDITFWIRPGQRWVLTAFATQPCIPTISARMPANRLPKTRRFKAPSASSRCSVWARCPPTSRPAACVSEPRPRSPGNGSIRV